MQFIRFPLCAILVLGVGGCGKKEGESGDPEAGPEGIAMSEPAILAPGEIQASPLADRGAGGKTLFERIGSEQSGIDFVHRWDPRDDDERELLSTSFAGGGVALGDIDNDGLAEVFVTRPHGGCRLYRNLGGMKFEDITAKVGLEQSLANYWAISATFVDIQGDGFLDLYVCGYARKNFLFVSDGQGRFTESASSYGLDFSGASLMMSFTDYDRDGDLDAYLLTNRLMGQSRPEKLDFKVSANGEVSVPEQHRDELGALMRPDGQLEQFDAGQRDRLYRNDDGIFVDTGEGSGIRGHHQGLSATWWDYNEDGWIDLYVANDFFGQDHLYQNNKDGTFRDVIAEAVPHTPWFSMGSDAGDLNGDGRLDFIASDMSSTTHYKQKLNMGDMDEQGWFLETPSPRQYMRNAVYLNTGTERFLEVAHLAGLSSTDWTWAVKIGDYDADGLNDVFFTNGMSRDFFNADLRAEVQEIHERTGRNPWSDEKYVPLKEQNRIYRNRGSLAFEDVVSEWGLTEETASFGAATGDLDGDGDLDLVVNNFEERVGLYRNNSAGGNLLKVALQGRAGNAAGVGAELRLRTGEQSQVRVLHPVRGYLGCDVAEAVFGLGETSAASELRIRWPSGVEQTVQDLRAGHRYFIAEPTGSFAEEVKASVPLFGVLETPAQHEERPYNDFAIQPLLPNKLSLDGPALACADVDGDGRQDFFLGGGAGSAGQLWMQPTAQSLVPRQSDLFAGSTDSEDVDALFFDADADGDLDLYVVAGGVEHIQGSPELQDRLYLNLKGVLQAAPAGTMPNMKFSGSSVAAADVDGDGDQDLFVGARVVPGHYPTSERSRLLLNDGSALLTDAEHPALEKVGMVTDALWSDIDGDGDPDLLVTTEYGPVKVFRNEKGQLREATEEAGLANLLGWWNCIDGADLDGDGDQDFAVGNFGLNTKYHVSRERPQYLYYGAFGEGGGMNCVEAHPDGERIVPNRGRSCSSGAMPFINEKFSTFHDFAISDLVGIYTKPRLEQSLRLEVNELRSGLLINDGTGSFSFRALPQLAQVAPSFGLAFFQADGDGKVDLYVSQNFYGPQRETGRMAGGLGALLLGLGDGGFREVWPEESGIMVPQDARGVEVVDLDGDGREDIAVAINSGRLKVLLNRVPR